MAVPMDEPSAQPAPRGDQRLLPRPSVVHLAKEREGEGEEDSEIEVEATEDVDAPEVESVEKGEEDSPDYSSLKVAELKELLKAAGKPVSGKKADLIARLME